MSFYCLSPLLQCKLTKVRDIFPFYLQLYPLISGLCIEQGRWSLSLRKGCWPSGHLWFEEQVHISIRQTPLSLNVLCSHGRIGRTRILDFCEKSPDIKTEKRFKTDFLLVLFNISSSNKQTLYGQGKVCPQITTLGALLWASEMLGILSAQTLKGCITGSHIFPWKYIIYKSQ